MKLLTSPILYLFTVIAIVLTVFLVKGPLSLGILYATGIGVGVGAVLYFAFHRFNKSKPGYKSDIDGHNDNSKIGTTERLPKA